MAKIDDDIVALQVSVARLESRAQSNDTATILQASQNKDHFLASNGLAAQLVTQQAKHEADMRDYLRSSEYQVAHKSLIDRMDAGFATVATRFETFSSFKAEIGGKEKVAGWMADFLKVAMGALLGYFLWRLRG